MQTLIRRHQKLIYCEVFKLTIENIEATMNNIIQTTQTLHKKTYSIASQLPQIQPKQKPKKM
jgi:hypothetical protein